MSYGAVLGTAKYGTSLRGGGSISGKRYDRHNIVYCAKALSSAFRVKNVFKITWIAAGVSFSGPEYRWARLSVRASYSARLNEGRGYEEGGGVV